MDEQKKKRKSYYKPRPKQEREKLICKGISFKQSIYSEILAIGESKSFSKTVILLIEESLKNRKKGDLQAEN